MDLSGWKGEFFLPKSIGPSQQVLAIRREKYVATAWRALLVTSFLCSSTCSSLLKGKHAMVPEELLSSSSNKSLSSNLHACLISVANTSLAPLKQYHSTSRKQSILQLTTPTLKTLLYVPPIATNAEGFGTNALYLGSYLKIRNGAWNVPRTSLILT